MVDAAARAIQERWRGRLGIVSRAPVRSQPTAADIAEVVIAALASDGLACAAADAPVGVAKHDVDGWRVELAGVILAHGMRCVPAVELTGRLNEALGHPSPHDAGRDLTSCSTPTRSASPRG